MFTNKTKRSNSLVCNTQQKFKSQLRQNHSFETASGMLRKTESGSQLKQTKLSLCQKDNKLIFSGFVEEPIKIKPKHEFVYMPVPNGLNKSVYFAKENSKTTTTAMCKIEPLAALPPSPMSRPERNLLSLIGRVDFCIQMQQTQTHLNALWNVYGKLLRIIAGKRGEQTLLLRNEEKGPILQAIFYDFEGYVKSLTNGCYVHVVGRFMGENRLKTFSVSQVSTSEWQQNFTRIENVISYILMQNGQK